MNTYILKFPVDYNLTFDREKNIASSSLYDQDFYDKTIEIRSVKKPFCTFRIQYLFISEDSLEMSVSSPHFSDGEFTNNAMIVPGKYNIGEWARPVDCTFILKEGIDTINFNKGEDWLYLNFHTNQKIKLQKFMISDSLTQMIISNIDSKMYEKKGIFSLSKYYDMYKKSKMKDIILKEIKRNLI
jgi:hypothetical protein